MTVMVFDTETTGLPLHEGADLRKQPHIIEFGCALLSRKTGAVEERASILINPGELVSAFITKLTGITNEMLSDAGDFAAALPQLERLFSGVELVIAHNMPFDKFMMRCELMRANAVGFGWPPRELCTLGAFRHEWGRDVRLIELYERTMGRRLDQTHRAAGDVDALVEIVQERKLWKL